MAVVTNTVTDITADGKRGCRGEGVGQLPELEVRVFDVGPEASSADRRPNRCSQASGGYLHRRSAAPADALVRVLTAPHRPTPSL